MCVADELLWLHEVGFFATPQFASPELVNLWSLSHSGQRKVPHILYNAVKADSWSVGAILFELAAGEGLVQAGPGFDRAAVIGMSADVTLWWLETIHNCHTLREVRSLPPFTRALLAASIHNRAEPLQCAYVLHVGAFIRCAC